MLLEKIQIQILLQFHKISHLLQINEFALILK